jgi:2-iminobutanoate/2-iminopropanoate deaminase
MRIYFCSLVLTSFLLTAAQAADRRAIVPPEFVPAAGAPAPPYSPGILIDGTLYVAGQIGEDLKTKEVPADFEAEVKTCLERVGLVLKAAGMGYQDAVSVQVYLTDIDLFARMNAVYTTYFKEPRPARTAIAVVKLPSAKAHIEITVTARK